MNISECPPVPPGNMPPTGIMIGGGANCECMTAITIVNDGYSQRANVQLDLTNRLCIAIEHIKQYRLQSNQLRREGRWQVLHRHAICVFRPCPVIWEHCIEYCVELFGADLVPGWRLWGMERLLH
jgi:hypothetical protein